MIILLIAIFRRIRDDIREWIERTLGDYDIKKNKQICRRRG
jgi:hypothetical protein